MHKLLILIGISLSSLAVKAQSEPSEILMIGSFHFSNPGLDLVKTDITDVMSEENQKYLTAMSQKISQFKPTVVMLEFNPENTETINKNYQEYLAGKFELPVNEIYQIGFRVAKLSGVKRLISLDERTVGWNAEPMFEYMETKDSYAKAMVAEYSATLSAQSSQDQRNLTLQQLMIKNNDTDEELKNKSFYLMTNWIGADDGFSGADATASWWHRNFRIYAKIQQQARAGQRVFALAGQGHVAILRDFLGMDPLLEGVEVKPYLMVE